MKTLTLTSPHMRGPEVLEAQRHLKAAAWLEGTVDGEFGPDTARACKRAKYWLGYPERAMTPTYGDTLEMLLDYYLAHKGTLPPTSPAYRARRALRWRKAKDEPIRLRALKYLKTKVGEKESPPGSNRVEWASVWYGLPSGAWCAMAATRAYVEAGSKAFKRGSRYAYCPYIVSDARAGRNHLAITYLPQPGDLVLYDWQRDGVADHIGLYDHPTGPSSFVAIEGNTSTSNDSDGGEVMQRSRQKSQVIAYVHVGA